MLAVVLSIAASLLGLLGSLILAFSLDRPLAMLRIHLGAIEHMLSAAARGETVPMFVGFEKQHGRATAVSVRRVKHGAFLLALACLLQLLSTTLAAPT